MHEFIFNELPDNYNTIVGENGVKLSGGQRQRIGIARAIYHNPELLVLDEATSSLDNLTEEFVMNSIVNKMGKKTIIIVAHRLSTIKQCDKIFFLNNGKLEQEGSYENLYENNQNFRKMILIKNKNKNT
jgi:ABC-type multidrug transport system fused ATPase/permease subunit